MDPVKELLNASSKGDTNKIHKLLSSGVNINSLGPTGMTALMTAVLNE